MKEIKAIVQPFMKDKVLTALRQLEGLPGITVSEVIGCGRPHTGEDDESGAEAGHLFAPKTKLEIVVSDELLETVLQTVTLAAWTGKYGDGKIFVSNVLDAIKIRTRDRGADAI